MTDSISKNVQFLPEVTGSSPPGLKLLGRLHAFFHFRTSAHAHAALF